MNLYPDGNAFYLKQKLAAKLGVTPANLILGNGSNEIIEFVGHALLAPGAEVVVSQYCFAVYPIVTALFGGEARRRAGQELRARPRRHAGRDHAANARRLRRQPEQSHRHPSAARTWPAFVDAVPEHVLLALDEAYIEFLDEPLDLLPDIRSGRKPNLLLMRTFSKIYGLAGLRLGYGIGHPDLIAALEKIRQPFNINCSPRPAPWRRWTTPRTRTRPRKITPAGSKFYARAFRKLGLEFVPSSANFILVRVGDGQRVFDELQKLGVIVRPMGGYQLPEWIRISVGTPKENERCLEALQDGSRQARSACAILLT